MKSRVLISAALFLVFSCSGCDSDRLTQFGAFAAAGTEYVTTFQKFTSEVGDAFIAADSATFITARNIAGNQTTPELSESNAKRLTEDDAALKGYLANLQKLNEHAALLGQYFTAITQLTDGKAASATVTSLDSLVDSINTFNPQIENVSFAGKNVKDFIAPVTNLAVAHFEVRALDAELQKSAPVIDKALSLQEAAVAALTSQMQSSLAASLEVQESTTVINPYVAAGPLPGSWAANRAAYIKQTVTLQSADGAKAAITGLRKAFRELVADKSAKIDFKQLMDDIGKMATFASAAKATAS